MLQVLDSVWAEFLKDVDSLKTDAGIRAFAQLNAEDEFRLEASKAPLHLYLNKHLCRSVHSQCMQTGSEAGAWFVWLILFQYFTLDAVAAFFHATIALAH